MPKSRRPEPTSRSRPDQQPNRLPPRPRIHRHRRPLRDVTGQPQARARYRDPSGRERKRSFARMTDARRFLVGVEDSKLRGAYVPPEAGRDVFAEWAERWFRTTADLKPGTRRTYRQLLDN